MRRLGKGRFRLFRGQRGFTLMEVLVAVGILGFIGVAFMMALDTSYRGTSTLDEKIVGRTLVINYLEAIKSAPYATTYPDVGDNITVPFQYSVVVNTECSSDGENFSACTGGETLQEITIMVSREGRPVYSTCTYRSKR